MGAFVAASAVNSGCEVYWASAGRSPQTRQRAEKVGLTELRALAELCETCSVLVSVCPPRAAEEVADQVLAQGFDGLYVDANAISPQWVIHIGQKMAAAGVSFVDGGIIGGPAWESGQTWLYLLGERAQEVSPLFSAGPLQTAVLGDQPDEASALKMCYAAWTKGSTALRSTILAVAESYGVWSELKEQWERDWPGFPDQTIQRARRAPVRAWRFAREMEEIASTFAAARLPGGFHLAAADIYRRLAGFKDAPSLPPLVKRTGDRAGVHKANVHRFRHTFAIEFLRNQPNVFALQRMLGHSSLEMVRRYLAIAQADVEVAHQEGSPVANWAL